jgi:hypothetical protein
MTPEKSQSLLKWLYKELEKTSQDMKDARIKNSLDSLAKHEGEADALLRIIKKIKNEILTEGT